MNAYEFQTRETSDGKREVPDAFFEELPRMQEVQVLVLIKEPTDAQYEEHAWARLTAEQFLTGYRDSDVIYDQQE